MSNEDAETGKSTHEEYVAEVFDRWGITEETMREALACCEELAAKGPGRRRKEAARLLARLQSISKRQRELAP